MSQSDTSLLDLFRSEMETHVAVLNEGLLTLERNPSARDRLEAMMRAAHSIKGGARIVDLEPVVRVAHAMEDCFVAVQKGEIHLASEHVDLLLQGVDFLCRLVTPCQGPGEEQSAWSGEELEAMVTSLSTLGRAQGPPPAPPVPGPVPKEDQGQLVPLTPVPEAPPETALKEVLAEAKVFHGPSEEQRDRMVRVTAQKIERLMGLAGEVVVQSRWLPPFSQSLLDMKKNQLQVFNLLEALKELMERGASDDMTRELLKKTRDKTKECGQALADRINQFDLFVSSSANLSDRLYQEVIGVRMRPFADGVGGFPRMVRDLAKGLGKKVNFEIVGQSTEVDRDILEKLDAPLTHLLRNAVDHGIESPEERIAAAKPETGTLRLEAAHRAGMLMITVSDDGRGLDMQKIQQKILRKGLATSEMVEKLTEQELIDFLFLPGFSTAESVTEISGRGVGLNVVQSMVQEVGGVIRAASRAGAGLAFQMELPLTLSVIRTFLVEIAGESYAFPLARIDRCLVISPKEIATVEDRQYFRFNHQNIALVNIHDVLGIRHEEAHSGGLNIVVVSDRIHSYGLLVDRFLGECDLVVRPLDSRLGKVSDISAAAVMLDGSPVLIFDVEDLVRSIDNLLSGRRLRKVISSGETLETRKEKRILVVDDSITVREMERKLLENRGYQVEVAVDGLDGWNAVRSGKYDLVVTDVDMPRMNGIELIKQIKNHPLFKSMPVIIISYKDREEDRMGGLEAGANYYLTKSSFQDDSLIEAVVDLVGEA